MMTNKFSYTTAIRKIRKMKGRIKVIPGGSSAGKTFGIIPILIDKAIKTKLLSISVVSESYPHLKRGAMRDFINIMKMTNRYVDAHWNRTNSIYTFENGSYIEFFASNDDSKLRGARRNILYINECNNVKKESYIQLAMRTDMDIYLDYNPSHKFWVEEVKEDKDSETLVLTYKDNEALSPTVIEFLESKRELAKHNPYWENWCKVYLDGQLGSLEGVVFSNWTITDTVPDEATLVGYGMDFGFSNDPTTLIAVYKYDGKLILDEIIYQKGLTNGDIAKLMKTHKINTEVIADSAEPKSIAELKRYGLRVTGVKKGKDSISYGISTLQEFDMLITRRSRNLIDELEKYMWKKEKDGSTSNTPIDAFNHCIDAIRYLAMMKLGKKVRSGRTFSF